MTMRTEPPPHEPRSAGVLPCFRVSLVSLAMTGSSTLGVRLLADLREVFGSL